MNVSYSANGTAALRCSVSQGQKGGRDSQGLRRRMGNCWLISPELQFRKRKRIWGGVDRGSVTYVLSDTKLQLKWQTSY